jgi:hypothetical protein
VGEERDVGIGASKQRDQPLGHAASELAAMLLLEFHRVGEPAHGVAERADRKLDQHLAIGGGIIVRDELLILLPDFEAEAHEITLAAVDAPALELGLEQDVAGIKVTQLHPPGMLALRKHDPAAAVEIEAQPSRALLRWNVGRRRIGGLGRGSRGRARFRRRAPAALLPSGQRFRAADPVAKQRYCRGRPL